MFAFLLTAALCVSTGRDLHTEVKKENLRLLRTNKVLRQVLSSIQTESKVGSSDCDSPPDSKCELCQPWMPCEGKQYVITSYAVVDGAKPHFLFGCTYPKTYTYVDLCPQDESDVAVQVSEEASVGRDFGDNCPDDCVESMIGDYYCDLWCMDCENFNKNTEFFDDDDCLW